MNLQLTSYLVPLGGQIRRLHIHLADTHTDPQLGQRSIAVAVAVVVVEAQLFLPGIVPDGYVPAGTGWVLIHWNMK